MNNRWSPSGLGESILRWGDRHGAPVAECVYAARLLGADRSLVLHGGGNVSVKGSAFTPLDGTVTALFIKASGHDLASLDIEGLPGLELAPLQRLLSRPSLSDEDMVRAFRRLLLNPDSPLPSIETLVHAALPQRFVFHSHADAVLMVTNQPNGPELVREVLGDDVVIVPYVRPGFDLARALHSLSTPTSPGSGPAPGEKPSGVGPMTPGVFVLLQHGLITASDDARAAYDRHLSIVDTCAQWVEQRTGTARSVSIRQGAWGEEAQRKAGDRAAKFAPILRGLLAQPTGCEDRPLRGPIVSWRGTPEILAFLEQSDAESLTQTPPLTADHLIRTGPFPLFVDPSGGEDEQGWRSCLVAGLERYRAAQTAYVARAGGERRPFEAHPRVVLIRGVGAFSAALTFQEAAVASDITEHTLRAKHQVALIGRFAGLSEEHLFDQEFRGLQQRKLPKSGGRPLEGRVVVISGGAGAIGTEVAEVCAEAGAVVVLTDVDESRLSEAVNRVGSKYGSGGVLGVSMDVTDERSVGDGFARIARTYGGVDVLVLNAGVAHVAPIETLRAADFRRVLEINTVGYLLFMQAGVAMMKKQGFGGHVVINASKNVFSPGKDFGAYSAAKAAGHQLGKVAAIELASLGIRVNMINADAIFGDPTHPSGLWQSVGPERARTRQVDAGALPEFYRQRSLLKTTVRGRHVGHAVVFFASNATPTTGATLPIDGGIPEAFPR